MRASDKILERLLTLHPKIIDLSLDRMHDILARLGNPQENLPPVIHIAGTNGKGSTTAYLRSILEEANLSVHVYTSPHLVRFAERIRLAGKIIEEDYLTETLEYCEEVNEGRPITYFEITTAAALKAFADTPADVLILEVGLGGRLDATNVIDEPLSTVITPVSLDHEQFLGSNIEHIAMEKASIAKKGVPLLSAKQVLEVETKIKEVVQNNGGEIIGGWTFEATKHGFNYNDRSGSMKLPLPNLCGPHQVSNAALAIATLRHQDKFAITDEQFAKGITQANWPARMQDISDSVFGNLLPKGSELWLDGGHNPAAGQTIANSFEGQNLIMICGMMKNKDVEGFLMPIAQNITHFFGINVEGEDSHSETDIVKHAWSLDIKAETAKSVRDALEKINSSVPVKVIICGSLYLAGQVLGDNDLIPD